MAVVTLLNNATANGPGTVLDCQNAKKASFVITGTFKAAVNFEFSQDGVNYYPFTGLVNGGLQSSVTYSAGHVLFDVEPVAYIRPSVSAYESGSITVNGYVDDAKITSVSLSGRKMTYALGNYDQLLTTPPGGTTDITITPPAGKRYRPLSMRVDMAAVAGATGGSVTVYWGYISLDGNLTNLYATQAYNATLLIREFDTTTGATFSPNDRAAFGEAIRALVATQSAPLTLRVANNTDVALNQTAIIRVLWEVEDIVS